MNENCIKLVKKCFHMIDLTNRFNCIINNGTFSDGYVQLVTLRVHYYMLD